MMEPHDPVQVTLQVGQEISSMLTKKALEIVYPRLSPGYYFHYFLAMKTDGDYRPKFNLRGLDAHILCHKFCIETL